VGDTPKESKEDDLEMLATADANINHAAWVMRRPRLSVSQHLRCGCKNCVNLPPVQTSTPSLSQRLKRHADSPHAKSSRATTATDTSDNERRFDSSQITGAKSRAPSHLTCEYVLHGCPPRKSARKVITKNVDYMTPLYRRISGIGFDSLFGSGMGSGMGGGIGSGIGTGIGSGMGSGIGSGIGSGMGSGLGASGGSRGGGTGGNFSFETKTLDTPQMKSKVRVTSEGGSADWVAEVVVIGNSMMSSLKSCLDSLRCQHLLDCKGVEYFHVDISLDIGDDYPDAVLIRRWLDLNYVFRDRRKSTKNDVLVPQVLIDGVPIGGVLDLLELEDECDLDYILARESCPNCFAERRDETSCRSCEVPFRELVTIQFLPKKQIERLMNRNIFNGGRVGPPKKFTKRQSLAPDHQTIMRLGSVGPSVEIPLE